MPKSYSPKKSRVRFVERLRKNWLFAATEKGAKASANLYSLVETAKANNVEPSIYLKEVFTRLPAATCVEDIEALLPWNVAKAVR